MAGKSRCSSEGCTKWSVAKGMCSSHARQAEGLILRCIAEGCRRRAAVPRKEGLCVYHACPHRRCGVPSCEKLKQWQSSFCINHTRLIGPVAFTGAGNNDNRVSSNLQTPSVSLPDFFIDPMSGFVLAEAAKQHLQEDTENQETNLLNIFNQSASLTSQ